MELPAAAAAAAKSATVNEEQTVGGLAPDDDDSSSVFVRTIRRIIQRTRSTPPTTRLAYTNRRRRISHDTDDIELGSISVQQQHDDDDDADDDDDDDDDGHLIDRRSSIGHQSATAAITGGGAAAAGGLKASRSLFSASNLSVPSYEFRGGSQHNRAFDNYEIESSTDNNLFEFVLPSSLDELRKRPPHFARRHFVQTTADNSLASPETPTAGGGAIRSRRRSNDRMGPIERTYSHHSVGDLSESSEPDLNTKWSWKNLKKEFKITQSENLFHLYQAKLQHSFFVALLILNIIFNFGAIISYLLGKFNDMSLYLILMRFAAIAVFVSFIVLVWFNQLWMQSKFSRTVASLAVLLAMIFGEASGAICALVNDQATPLASIRRTYYLIITNHVFLPFPSRIQSCAATIVITSFEIIVTYISRRDNNCRADYLTKYSIADIIFYASSAMIGFQITFLLEIAIRRTFLNHKYCIQSTYKLNYEKEQQEQLLRSCFPQHLIEQIRSEIRESIARISKRQSVPFKPFYNLYVEKYENVTILYADIVNSMNLTDKLNPAELVETLNELYGRFDESAEKHSCLRIKLLGDCYYCVSGLPEFDEDHAMNCLLMGLEMIKIIGSIRESRDVDIDMRIGIHSGSVLSGLLGLRKWQFDIWSFDAMKANRMEHNGQPGFVHITQETLNLLPKDHERRKDLIITATRQSDDSETTYLVSERFCASRSGKESPQSRRRGQTEKLKACIEKLRVRSAIMARHGNAIDFTYRRQALETSLRKYREIHAKVDETLKTAIANMPLGSAWKQLFFMDCLGNGRTKNHDNNKSVEPSKMDINPADGGVDVGNKRGRNYANKSKSALSAEHRMAISNSSGGKQIGQTSGKGPGAGGSKSARSKSTRPMVRSPSNKALVQTDPLFHLYLICVGLITLSILAIKWLIPGMPIYAHTVIGFAFLLAIIVTSIIYTQFKSRKINIQFRILLWLIISASLTMLQLVDLIVPTNEQDADPDVNPTDSLNCAFTWYYTFTIIVAMTATSIFIRINVWLKFIIHSATVVFYIIINNPPTTMFETLKEFFQTRANTWSILDHKYELSHLFYIVMIAVILHLIDRQVEYILGLNIQWNEQLESDRVESQTVGQINRILLENILPPHVLKRYLYNTTVSYDQLYHESHPSCAVMFASIPNYESFYSENNLNEQGLKCLQLLNEIICDFDQLLSHPAFRTIEKIKTIGPTYMAACFDVNRRTSDCTIDTPEFNGGPDSMANWYHGQQQAEQGGGAGSYPRHLSKRQSRSSLELDELEMSNVVTMVCFATALMENLARINRDAFQEFRPRIGIATGPVIAGVVGASKPTYDIWGDTVNVASRLESLGISGRIQVSERVARLLDRHGQFELECRGPVFVKGKGRLTTYLVVTPYDNIEDTLDSSADHPKGPLGQDDDHDGDESPPPPALAADDEVEELCSKKQHHHPISKAISVSAGAAHVAGDGVVVVATTTAAATAAAAAAATEPAGS